MTLTLSEQLFIKSFCRKFKKEIEDFTSLAKEENRNLRDEIANSKVKLRRGENINARLLEGREIIWHSNNEILRYHQPEGVVVSIVNHRLKLIAPKETEEMLDMILNHYEQLKGGI